MWWPSPPPAGHIWSGSASSKGQRPQAATHAPCTSGAVLGSGVWRQVRGRARLCRTERPKVSSSRPPVLQGHLLTQHRDGSRWRVGGWGWGRGMQSSRGVGGGGGREGFSTLQPVPLLPGPPMPPGQLEKPGLLPLPGLPLPPPDIDFLHHSFAGPWRL